MNLFGLFKPRDPGFRKDLGFNPNPLNQPTVSVILCGSGGWIPFSSAQPDFDITVQIRRADGGIGIGRRSRKIVEEAKQEQWDCVFLEKGPGAITHWRPI